VSGWTVEDGTATFTFTDGTKWCPPRMLSQPEAALVALSQVHDAPFGSSIGEDIDAYFRKDD
jgi:hypothetical protein